MREKAGRHCAQDDRYLGFGKTRTAVRFGGLGLPKSGNPTRRSARGVSGETLHRGTCGYWPPGLRPLSSSLAGAGWLNCAASIEALGWMLLSLMMLWPSVHVVINSKGIFTPFTSR